VHRAARRGVAGVVQARLDARGPIEVVDERDEGTALHVAADHGRDQIVAPLARGANTAAVGPKGMTPFSRALPGPADRTVAFL
jgi:hypothetical protein